MKEAKKATVALAAVLQKKDALKKNECGLAKYSYSF